MTAFIYPIPPTASPLFFFLPRHQLAYLKTFRSFEYALQPELYSTLFFIMAHNDNDQYAEFFDAGHSGKDHTVHQRLRANSTIMQLKKILGAMRTLESCPWAPLSTSFADIG